MYYGSIYLTSAFKPLSLVNSKIAFFKNNPISPYLTLPEASLPLSLILQSLKAEAAPSATTITHVPLC